MTQHRPFIKLLVSGSQWITKPKNQIEVKSKQWNIRVIVSQLVCYKNCVTWPAWQWHDVCIGFAWETTRTTQRPIIPVWSGNYWRARGCQQGLQTWLQLTTSSNSFSSSAALRCPGLPPAILTDLTPFYTTTTYLQVVSVCLTNTNTNNTSTIVPSTTVTTDTKYCNCNAGHDIETFLPFSSVFCRAVQSSAEQCHHITG